MNKRTKKFIFFIVTFLVILTGGAFAYLSESYAPTSEALSALSSSQEVQVDRHKNYIAFMANESSEEVGSFFIKVAM